MKHSCLPKYDGQMIKCLFCGKRLLEYEQMDKGIERALQKLRDVKNV